MMMMLMMLIRMAGNLIAVAIIRVSALRCVMVLCDKEVEIDSSHKMFGVIGVRVAPSVVHVLLSHLEIEVDDLEWVVTRMKAESLAELKPTGLFILFICSV